MKIDLKDILFTDAFKVGFHATSSKSCDCIESKGFLPSKILTEAEQTKLIGIAKDIGIDVESYLLWLTRNSVTFPKDFNRAIKHIQQGGAGGQGLIDITSILDKLDKINSLDSSAKDFVKKLRDKIQNIQRAAPVIYAVDLSKVKNLRETDYDYFFDADESMPSIDSSHIIAKLIFSYQEN